MTPAATPEALVEARRIADEAANHPMRAASEYARRTCENSLQAATGSATPGPQAEIDALRLLLTTAEADLQRVTAERDEAQEIAKQFHGSALEAEEATAEAARLRAEVEAKDRARWRPIATAPTDRPVVVRMRTDRLQGGWFVATVTLPDPDDDSRFGSCSTIWHYNGDTLMTQFRGTWTDWLDDGGSDRTALARAASAGEGRSDG